VTNLEIFFQLEFMHSSKCDKVKVHLLSSYTGRDTVISNQGGDADAVDIDLNKQNKTICMKKEKTNDGNR
jgi:hypothetical protein